MRTIVYIQRHPKAGFSIKKVFKPIISSIDPKETYEVPFPNASLYSLYKNIKYIFSKRKKDAIFHITGDIHYGIIGLIKKRSVLTIHDTVTIDFNNDNKLKRFLKKLLWFTLPLKFASKVVCISDTTRRYVEKYTSRKDLEVIHNCVDPAIQYQPIKENPIFRFLIVGTNQNKNIERMIEALEGLNCELVIVGKLSSNQEELLKRMKIKYENKYNLSDEELYEEYYNSNAVLFCSLFEGFGMPVLEANKAGRPIICSNIPVLKEVAGDAALFVDPYDIKSIREGCDQIIQNADLQEKLIKKGIINAEKHNKNSIVKQWEKLYNSLS